MPLKRNGYFQRVPHLAAAVAGLLLTQGPALAQPRFVVCHYGKPNAACVHDGDTLWLAGEKIRLWGIDAPEMGPPRCKRPAGPATASRDALIGLLNGGAVTLERHGHDKYGRTLARVLVDGADTGDALVARGLARPYVASQAAWC